MAFLGDVDMGGEKVPAVWSEALKILEKNYANSLVISAFANLMHYKIMIITVHGVNCCHPMFLCLFPLPSANEIKFLTKE